MLVGDDVGRGLVLVIAGVIRRPDGLDQLLGIQPASPGCWACPANSAAGDPLGAGVVSGGDPVVDELLGPLGILVAHAPAAQQTAEGPAGIRHALGMSMYLGEKYRSSSTRAWGLRISREKSPMRMRDIQSSATVKFWLAIWPHYQRFSSRSRSSRAVAASRNRPVLCWGSESSRRPSQSRASSSSCSASTGRSRS